MTKFLYIADPMCSWCYGFGPELLQFLKEIPDAQIDLLVGGLRAYNKQELDDENRQMILGHWEKVHEVSGLPFDQSALSTPHFIYDTEPSCRAVVAAKLLTEEMPGELILHVFHALQNAFYAQAQDITSFDVLAKVAVAALNEAIGDDLFDEVSFLETLMSPSTIEETRLHFDQIRQWGVRGYPVLLMVKPEGLHMLTSGYTSSEQLMLALKSLES